MQQHPIPQNVSAYEFHLIGNMTLKQFVELGAGVGVGVLIYSLKLPGFIGWPLIFISVLFGAAMAFLPFDGRPLDRMIIIFFKAVYSPTQYIWRKSATVPTYFTYQARKPTQPNQADLDRTRLKKNLTEYLSTLPSSGTQNYDYQSTADFSQQESQYLQSVNELFQTVQPAAQVQPGGYDQSLQTAPTVRVRAMKTPKELPKQDIRIKETLNAVNTQVEIPSNTPIQVTETPGVTADKITTITQNTQTVAQPQSNTRVQAVAPNNVVEATTNTQLPFPQTPTQANFIVGMVVDNQGKIIDDAVIEILDKKHNPIRALKTNQLGQFFAASSLKNGTYELVVNKPGYQFAPISLKLKNKIVPPIEIKAK